MAAIKQSGQSATCRQRLDEDVVHFLLISARPGTGQFTSSTIIPAVLKSSGRIVSSSPSSSSPSRSSVCDP